MSATCDGPVSPYFTPLSLAGNVSLAGLVAGEAQLPPGASAEMKANLAQAPAGEAVAWGIPFQIDRVVILDRQPVTVPLPSVKTRWLVFQHTADVRPLAPGPDGICSPMPGEGRLGEHAADYVLCYTDGVQERIAIRRRYQVGMFQRKWGENCLEAVAHRKPHPLQAGETNGRYPWGLTQTRGRIGDDDLWVNWVWAWENPYPERELVELRFEPVEGVLLIAAVTAGQVDSLPLRWRTRCKARMSLPAGESFQSKLDARGLLAQVQLDLGQVISATLRPLYPNDRWEDTRQNLPPERTESELLIEYTAHPQACFHLKTNAGEELIPVAQVESGEAEQLQPVTPATQTVLLRVVDKGSRKLVPVKLHMHGQAGEYLAPVDRHRILNPWFFEDYSADFLHVFAWPKTRAHSCTYINGEARLKLPLGRVYLEVTKGFEIRPVRRVVEIGLETQELVIEVEQVLPWRLRGWVTADTHVHFLSPVNAMLEGAAEGVNVVNLLASQWGELMTNVGDFDGRNTWGALENGGGPEGNGEYLVRVGSENRQHVLGHISLLGYQGALIAPMTTGGPDESALGDPVESLLIEWARQCHVQGGVVVLPHFPNPRAENAASIVSGEIDAVEMTSWEDLYSGINPYSLSDWYRYLNCGYLVPAVGGTDKMNAATAVGTVRTYAHLAPDQPFSYAAWMEAVRRRETFVTYGPLLEFSVDGHPMGSQLELPAEGGTLEVSWQIASLIVPVTRLELVVNGEIRESLELPPEGSHGHWSVRLDHSAWLALRVRGKYADMPEIIAAHSTPVMVMLSCSPLLAQADAVTILDQIEGALVYLDTIGTRAEDRVYKRMRMELEAAHRRLHNRMHQAGLYHAHLGE